MSNSGKKQDPPEVRPNIVQKAERQTENERSAPEYAPATVQEAETQTGYVPAPPVYRSVPYREAGQETKNGQSNLEHRPATIQETGQQVRYGPFPPVYTVVPVQEYGRPPRSSAFTSVIVPGAGMQPRTEPGFAGFGSDVGQQTNGQPEWADQFMDKKIRRAFIRKVYSIVALQLLFTFGVICLCMLEHHVRKFVVQNRVLLWIAMIVYIVAVLSLVCVEKLRRKFPLNLVMLTVITLCLSYVMAFLSCHFKTYAVLMAFGICAVICLGVTLLSFNTKLDFTNWGSILCISLIVLIIFGFLAIIFRSQIMTMIYAGAGALLFMAYLAFDTQLIMGGKRFEISPEEYVMAAVMLYIDVIYIFMYILMLVGGATGSSIN